MQYTKTRTMGLLCGALFFAGRAGAAPQLAITNQGEPVDSYSEAAPGYTGFLVTVTADSGDVISGIDAGGGTGSVNTGFTGPVLQEWDLSGRTGTMTTPTPYEADTNTPSGVYSTDTHFLINPANTTAVYADSEDNNLVDPQGAPTDVSGSGGDDWGTGSYLTGTFGITSATETQITKVAYIVLPNGHSGTYDFSVQESTPAGIPVGIPVTFSGMIGTASVPEPASLGLFAMGSLGLLVSRRGRRNPSIL